MYVVLLHELATRTLGVIQQDLPFFPTRVDWVDRLYPELEASGVRTTNLGPGDDHYDVLLLGGSVLDWLHRDQQEALVRELRDASGRAVRLFNLARPALNTRDSLAKSRELADRSFDLVIVYHAINELRLNNCPPDRFRNDYTQGGWYRKVGIVERDADLSPWLCTPRILRFALIDLGQEPALGWYLSRHRVREDWLAYGAEIRTAGPFRANLEGILARGDPTLLCSFAWYLPDDYTDERFAAKALDYGKHVTPTGTWGRPENVAEGLEVHNAILREVAAGHAHATLVDVDAAVPKDGRHFDDICHLTKLGGEIWVRLVVQAVQSRP